jgi:hypothetical protein
VNSWYHAKSSTRKWGGVPENYLDIHEFIDSSKQVIGDVRHRSLYHHTMGVFLCERIFGKTIRVHKNTKAIEVPVRLIAERHILEDLGWLPSPADYIDGMPVKKWMSGSVKQEINLSDVFKSMEESK